MKTIPLTPEDDIVSICDHLDWAREQQVIFVLPENGGVLREGLDLVRLLRHADNMRAEIALVTADPDISRQARALGIPVFLTIGAARQGKRDWRRGRRRREIVGLSTIGDDRFTDYEGRIRPDLADQAEAHKRLSPQSERRRWLWRYAAIFLFFLTTAVLYITFLYLLPSARITLRPEVLPVQVREMLRSLGFRVVIDFHGDLVRVELPQELPPGWEID